MNVWHDLKATLDEASVYEWHEVETFADRYFNDADAQELSPLIDVAADRFNHGLAWEEDEKADFKIKARQFVKIYRQMAALLPFEVVRWEQLYWFLRFLMPKLRVETPGGELDELLDAFDLSTYGLQRVRLNASIGLEEEESVLRPQNPNPRGAHGGEVEEDPLDVIVRTFNESWFHGWEATPEEQKVTLHSFADHMRVHPDFESKYLGNTDPQKQEVAFRKIFDDVASRQRRVKLEFYRMLQQKEFYFTMLDTMKRLLDKGA